MSLDTLKKRMEYYGGANQQERMFEDKLRTLKKALLYSYQAATAVLKDGRQFRCLINPDKNKPDYDNKIISIPFKDVCLNEPKVGTATQGTVQIGMKPGDVFVQKQNNEHWLVFLQSLDEKAYFRSEIRKCEVEVEVNGERYWIYIRGPVETDIKWKSKTGIVWNTLNYSIVFYITADDNTKEHFMRFANVKVLDPRDNKEKTWEVAGVNPFYGDGIIQVFANEYYENTIKEQAEKEKEALKPEEIPVDESLPFINGPKEVQKYSSVEYYIQNQTEGYWLLKESDGRIIDLQNNHTHIILNFTGKMGSCTLIYRVQGLEDITLPINVVAL